MLFNSIEFLFLFLPVTLVIYYTARRFGGHQAALALLTLASLVFYGWWNASYLALLLSSIIVNHGFGMAIRHRGSQPWLAIGIVFNLALTGVYKYPDFFVANTNAVTGLDLPLAHLALPLAISFFTFQQISYLVDVARNHASPGSVVKHALFVSFFPQLIAGPIIRHREIADQFDDAGRKDKLSDNLGIGFTIFALGLAKKVLLADNLEPFASSGFDMAAHGGEVGALAAWTSALCYAFQIFFDFSGYSDMALGLARMFGFHIPANFNAPYRATSIVDFWRRWHITLSRFLRDYLYIPLGGNRKGETRRWVNLFIVMLLGGLWHGAAWTFVVWGGLHGLGLAWCHWIDSKFPNGLFPKPLKFLAPLLTFAFVTFAWVFFRAESFAAASEMLAGMAGLNGLGENVGDEPFIAIIVSLAIIWALPDTISVVSRYLDPRTLAGQENNLQKGWRWSASTTSAILIASLFFIAIINSWTVAEFIYYRF
ncbi:MBOAT family O-acyltransferase [Maricaulis sp.]|uniref:MBOAT family O-acyltransferase n=1 Tax=Maricaulis sp. TaxID=1486257 RepID=UPI003A910253